MDVRLSRYGDRGVCSVDWSVAIVTVCVCVPIGCSKAFIYYPDCDCEQWRSIITKYLQKQYGGRKTSVYEVYLQTGELTSNTSEVCRLVCVCVW